MACLYLSHADHYQNDHDGVHTQQGRAPGVYKASHRDSGAGSAGRPHNPHKQYHLSPLFTLHLKMQTYTALLVAASAVCAALINDSIHQKERRGDGHTGEGY